MDIKEELRTLASLRVRDVVHQLVTIGLFFSLAAVGWRTFTLLSHCEVPVVVVISGSMEPGYERGDILFLHKLLPLPVAAAADEGEQLLQQQQDRKGDDGKTHAPPTIQSAAATTYSSSSWFYQATRWFRSPIVAGDIVVYNLPGRGIPIVHRVHRAHTIFVEEGEEGRSPLVEGASDAAKAIPDQPHKTTAAHPGEAQQQQKQKKQRRVKQKKLLLTKGDNNLYDDRIFYGDGVHWIEEEQVIGKSFAYIPKLGYITILFNESIVFKYLIVAILGFLLLTSNEQ